MRAMIKGGTIITPIETLSDSVVIIEDGRVSAVEPIRQVSSNPVETEIISADGFFVMPGLIDIHVHGGAGCDTMDGTQSALQNMSSFFLRHGVTAFLPTTVSQTSENISQAIHNIQMNSSCCSGAVPLGVHLEGPYLCEPYRGAHQVEYLHYPEPAEYRRWLDSGVVRLMTLAPELPGSLDLIREGAASGVRFSAGHTQASVEEVKSAIAAGLRHATHTFNGMAGLHHRDLGTTGALLADDRVICEIIADGIHVHPEVLKMVIRIKGLENMVLITDAMRAAGLTDGEYDLGGQPVHVSAGVA